MTTLKIYNMEGKETGTLDVSDKVFASKPNSALLHQVVMWYQNNLRQPLAHTKTKGEVRGGGAKPWAQKGTGRARHGSIRGPQWRKGGIVHGPRKDRDYTTQLPVAMRRRALAMCLSDKVKEGQLVVVDDLKLPEMKTKAVVRLLEALPTKTHSVLLATAKKDRLVEKASRNIPKVEAMAANSLNVSQVMKYQWLVMDTAGVKALDKQLG